MKNCLKYLIFKEQKLNSIKKKIFDIPLFMGSGRAAGTTTGEATTLVDVRPFDSMLSADV